MIGFNEIKQYIQMIYLSQLLRDCHKNRSTSFADLSFPIIHEIQNKIKNKNLIQRRKIKQKINQKQKLLKTDQQKQQLNNKKDSLNSLKTQKEVTSYLQFYQQQRMSVNQKSFNNYPINLDGILDQKEQSINLKIYLLLKKKKNIFKVEEAKRKNKNRQANKRINMKECQCCQKIGKHKCSHYFCQKKCQRYLSKSLADNNQLKVQPVKMEYQDIQAINIAQGFIQELLKNEGRTISMIRIAPQCSQQIPQIDVEEDQQFMDKAMISQNQSKSDIDNKNKNELQQRKQVIQKESQQQMINQEQIFYSSEEQKKQIVNREIRQQSQEDISHNNIEE